jgi:DNA helicase-2/ATP-dependent DNA helicase PcrA
MNVKELLTNLNPDQQQAVLATHGPVLILAGAGSGKTRTLTHRIAYLLQQKHAAPPEILAVTFTNKAAAEMKERVRSLTGKDHLTPTAIGTFHGLGARLLREQAQHLPRSRGFTICDAGDSERLIRHAMQSLHISTKEWSPKQLQHQISKAKNALLTPADIAATANNPAEQVLAQVYEAYQKLLAKNDSYDFDDLLIVPIELLQQQPDVRQRYQNKWRFISVDEYQDTNPPQDRLLELLLGPEKNLCVVGDDYQAIYSWRGAQVDHILRFETKFPNCATIYLTQNYRSTPAILEAANKVIAENANQKHKELWTAVTTGDPIRVMALPNDWYEASWVRQQIEQHVQQGASYSDFLILYRTNAQSRLFEEEFLKHRVPYTIVGGFRFYERREVKDALAFLQFWANPRSALSLQRIAENLWRGMGPKTLTKWTDQAEERGVTVEAYLAELAQTAQVIRAVVTAFTEARQQQFATVDGLLKFLLHRSGYLQWLRHQPESEDRQENIEELLNVASTYSDVATFLEEVALLTDLDRLQEAEERVTCMTLHASKGLEFTNVFVVGCEDGLLPHVNSLDNAAQLEEERRLLYVGMTRAKKRLTLTYAMTRYMRGEAHPQLPSRFFESLPAVAAETVTEDTGVEADSDWPFFSAAANGEPQLVAFQPGDMVTHPHFGRGVVIEVQGSRLMGVFEGHGLKTIDATRLKAHDS